MRLHKLLFSLLCVFSCLSLAFSGMCLDASADEQYLRLSWGAWTSMVGSSVQGYYLADDDTLKPITLTLRSNSSSQTGTITSVDMDASGSDMLVNSYLAVYECTIPSDVKLSSNSFLPVLQVDWNVHFSNVTYIGYVGGTFVNTVFTTLSRSSLSQYNYMQSGSSSSGVVSLPGRSSDASLAGLYKQSTVSSSYNCSGCFYSYTGNSTDLYIGSQLFSNLRSVGSNSNKWYIMLSAPFINPDYVFEGNDPPPVVPDEPVYDGGSSGTLTGTISDNGDGTQDIHVTVETDNSGLIGGIISGIKNLFVPSGEALESFSDDVEDEFIEHLGGIPEAFDLIDEQADYLRNAVSVSTIYVGQIRAPVGVDSGGNDVFFELGGWDVELKPEYQRLHVLYDALPIVIDLIAVFAVLNMLRVKFDILLNPEGECITYDS